MPEQTFAERLRELRLAAKLTQRELAERSGLTRLTISFLENGRRQPALETARKLSVALGKDLGDWE